MEETRNYFKDQEETIKYKHGLIKAHRNNWEEFNHKKEKWENKKQIICTLQRDKFLNLGECNDGSPFSAVSQAINQAKELIDYELDLKITVELYKYGYYSKDFLKYNKLKTWEILEIKQKLLNSAQKIEYRTVAINNKVI